MSNLLSKMNSHQKLFLTSPKSVDIEFATYPREPNRFGHGLLVDQYLIRLPKVECGSPLLKENSDIQIFRYSDIQIFRYSDRPKLCKIYIVESPTFKAIRGFWIKLEESLSPITVCLAASQYAEAVEAIIAMTIVIIEAHRILDLRVFMLKKPRSLINSPLSLLLGSIWE